jgi:hypothetical protein
MRFILAGDSLAVVGILVVEDSHPAAEEDTPAVADSHPAAGEDILAEEDTPAVADSHPAAGEDTPAEEDTPAVADSHPAAGEDILVAAVDSFVVEAGILVEEGNLLVAEEDSLASALGQLVQERHSLEHKFAESQLLQEHLGGGGQMREERRALTWIVLHLQRTNRDTFQIIRFISGN